MKTLRSIEMVKKSPFVNMGPIRLRQPIPNHGLRQVDPFILLHHFGPFVINAESNPFDLGPHPHRGFEPITLLYQGEQRHRDSMGNDSVVSSGDVQWTTAGKGIMHSEGPTKEFVERGGTLEGIQLWLNLPAKDKMMTPNYQLVKSDEMPKLVSDDGNITLKIVAGNQQDKVGDIVTQTSVNVYMVDAKSDGTMEIEIPKTHNSLVYLLNGSVKINDQEILIKDENQMVSFEMGEGNIQISSLESSQLLILSGEPIGEKIAQYGPYVMNTQTEIMEALRDFNQGKMGYLAY